MARPESMIKFSYKDYKSLPEMYNLKATGPKPQFH